MFDPATIGTIASAASSILGGLGGGKKRGPDFDDQMTMARMKERQDWALKKEMSDKYGINMLSMIGMNPAEGVQSAIFDDTGSGNYRDTVSTISDMGQGISGAMSSGLGAESQMIQDIGINQMAERGELENERLRSEIGLMRQAGASKALSQLGLDPDVITVPKEIIANDGNGQEKGTSPALQDFQFPGIGKVRAKSNALSSSMEDSIVGNLMVDLLYTVPDIATGAVVNSPKIARDYGWLLNKGLTKLRKPGRFGSAGR